MIKIGQALIDKEVATIELEKNKYIDTMQKLRSAISSELDKKRRMEAAHAVELSEEIARCEAIEKEKADAEKRKAALLNVLSKQTSHRRMSAAAAPFKRASMNTRASIVSTTSHMDV